MADDRTPGRARPMPVPDKPLPKPSPPPSLQVSSAPRSGKTASNARAESAEALRILLDAFVPPDLRETMERGGLVATAQHAARHHAWHHEAERGESAALLRERDLEIDRLRAELRRRGGP